MGGPVRDIGTGFRIGGRHLSWGTTADEAADALGAPRAAGRGSRLRRIEVACGPTYGFDTISAELTAGGGDRPVTALKYEIAAVRGESQPSPARWLDPLTFAFGRPNETEHRDVPDAHAEGSVRYYANWSLGEQSFGLSLYGAPRATEHGRAAGCLWLSWSIAAAARPFLHEWSKRAQALAAEADNQSGIVTFTTAEPQTRAFGWQDAGSRYNLHALEAPQLLPTPAAIALKLREKGIGFWRSGDQRRWFASTFWDTIGFEIGKGVEIDVYDIKPAKGGGYCEISVDGWHARDIHGSRPMAEAMEALRTIPGVTLREVDGYDC